MEPRLNRHWYASGGSPEAVTVNVALCPSATMLLSGCIVIRGATPAVQWLAKLSMATLTNTALKLRGSLAGLWSKSGRGQSLEIRYDIIFPGLKVRNKPEIIRSKYNSRPDANAVRSSCHGARREILSKPVRLSSLFL